MVRTICPSLPMRMKALGENAASAAPSALRIEGLVVKPMSRPPPSAALALRNCRRERSTLMSRLLLAACRTARRTVRRALDPLADSHVSAAAADIPRHGGIDSAIGRVRVAGEQGRGGHDLAGLAIAPLRHLQPDPR